MCYLIFFAFLFLTVFSSMLTWPPQAAMDYFGNITRAPNNLLGLIIGLILAFIAVALMNMWMNAKANRLHRAGKIPELVAQLMCYSDGDLATRRISLVLIAVSSNFTGIIGSIICLVLFILYIVYEVKCSREKAYRLQLVKQYNEEHPDAPLTRVPRRIRCYEYICYFILLLFVGWVVLSIIRSFV